MFSYFEGLSDYYGGFFSFPNVLDETVLTLND
jgi:hypothetical protein